MAKARNHLDAESIAAVMDGERASEDLIRHIAACRRCFHVLSEAIEVWSRLRNQPGLESGAD